MRNGDGNALQECAECRGNFGDGTLREAFTYDGLGRRTTATTGYAAATDFYYNAGWQLLQESTTVGGSTTVNARYLWGAGYIDTLVSRASGADGTYYALFDANTDITAISNGTSVAERFAYAADGTRTTYTYGWIGTTDSHQVAIGWQGLYWDAASGLYQARFRWYDPRLTCWSSWDPRGAPSEVCRRRHG